MRDTSEKVDYWFAACDVMNSITFISTNQIEEHKQHVSDIMVRQSVKKNMILNCENGTELKHNEGKNEKNQKNVIVHHISL